MSTNKAGQGVKALTPAEEKGKSRDIAASKLGISGVTGERGAAVLGVIEKLVKEGKKSEAEDLRVGLNKSVEGTYKKAITAGHIKVDSKKVTKRKATNTDSTAAAAGATSTPLPKVITKPGDPSAHLAATESADVVLTFLRSKDALKLTEAQKTEWEKIGEQIVKLLKGLGVKVSS
jgi:hypothetical protein